MQKFYQEGTRSIYCLDLPRLKRKERQLRNGSLGTTQGGRKLLYFLFYIDFFFQFALLDAVTWFSIFPFIFFFPLIEGRENFYVSLFCIFSLLFKFSYRLRELVRSLSLLRFLDDMMSMEKQKKKWPSCVWNRRVVWVGFIISTVGALRASVSVLFLVVLASFHSKLFSVARYVLKKEASCRYWFDSKVFLQFSIKRQSVGKTQSN